MDANKLFPKGFHPDWTVRNPNNTRDAKHRQRHDLRKPVRYYFADYGISTWFRDGDDFIEGESQYTRELRMKRHVVGGRGLLQAVPELSDDKSYDPFALDIFVLGTLIRETFVLVSRLESRIVSSRLHTNIHLLVEVP